MKLTNPDFIQKNEKEFIDSIKAELDWDAIGKLFFKNHRLTLEDEVDFKNGDIIIHKDSIAYQLDFELKMPLSIVLNRQGEFLELHTREQAIEDAPDEPVIRDEARDEAMTETMNDSNAGQDQDGKVARMALDIADMISEINEN